MRKMFLVLFSVIGAIAMSAPIRSMIGADGSDHIQEDVSYTAADYVQDGLVCMFDGIENGGYGIHDEETHEWMNLVDGISIHVGEANSFQSDFLYVSQKSYCIPTKELMNSLSPLTVEMIGFCGSFEPLCGIGWENSFSPYLAWGNQCYLFWQGIIQVSTPKNSGGPMVRNYCAITSTGTSSIIYFPKSGLRQEVSGTWERPQTYDSSLNANSGGICAIRLYNRALTDEEIYYNYMVDKERFGL